MCSKYSESWKRRQPLRTCILTVPQARAQRKPLLPLFPCHSLYPLPYSYPQYTVWKLWGPSMPGPWQRCQKLGYVRSPLRRCPFFCPPNTLPYPTPSISGGFPAPASSAIPFGVWLRLQIVLAFNFRRNRAATREACMYIPGQREWLCFPRRVCHCLLPGVRVSYLL